ncbi:MAG TPA: hypothetical protein PKO06_00020 [Candidatus Ozemobacteraceae bacterium]|nr:hypothetical protein [Candidatus Ozemobacteraceae bacterium]
MTNHIRLFHIFRNAFQNPMMRLTRLGLMVLLLGLSVGVYAETTGEPVPTKILPASVAEPGSLDQVKAPVGDLTMFCWFQPPEASRFGVADKDGGIVWEKVAGFRPMLDYFWSKDGSKIFYVTDCIQKEAELRAGSDKTRSWFFVLDAMSGKTLAEGDLDTDILDLPKQLPDAVGASHFIEVAFENDVINVTIEHQGKKVSGSKALKDLLEKK